MQDKHYGRQNKRREQRVDIRNSHNINDFYTNRQMHMTKPLKPGQLCTIDEEVYRAKARTCMCAGCSFGILSCPNLPVANEKRTQKIDCTTHWVILTKVEQ